MNNSIVNSNASIAMMQASKANLPPSGDIKNMKRIDETAQDFEAVFISEMMKPMFEGLKTDGMFDGGQAEEVFRSIMIQEFGKSMAKTEQLGIAAPVKAALIQAQAEQTKTSASTQAKQ